MRPPRFKQIAFFVVMAQIASDGGKLNMGWEREISRSHDAAYAYRRGYNVKQDYVDTAIDLIRSMPPHISGWDYYVNGGTPDQNGHTSSIYYFWFVDDNGKRRQISFHGFPEDYETHGKKTRWNHVLGGSFDTAKYLAKACKLF